MHLGSFQPSELILVKRAVPSTLRLPGSFVRLASGGPIGVVTSLDAADTATVAWLGPFGGRSVLPEVCLTPASNAYAVGRSERREKQT